MGTTAKQKKTENDNQINDWNTWCPGAKIGEVSYTELNPLAG
jgi:hypothetical protein